MTNSPKPFLQSIEALGFQIRWAIYVSGKQEFRFLRSETADYNLIQCKKIITVADAGEPLRLRQHYQRMLRFLKARMEQEKKL